MIVSFEEAQRLVKIKTKRLGAETVPVIKSLNSVIAEDIYSTINFPSIRQSAMDGYAINYSPSTQIYEIKGEIKAGDNASLIKIKKGEAIRIFTGAMVPVNANMIIRQEDAFVFDQQVKFINTPNLGANIREIGEQIKEKEIAVQKGIIVNPAAIGFLSMLGITEVKIFRKPKITIVTTGSELVKPGEKLQLGQIYESNSSTLLAALNQYGFNANHIQIKDSYAAINEVFKKELLNADLILFTGGISVGDYDFVGDVLADNSVDTIFYKVKQKPGKPIFFGKKGKVKIFGLPGNPAAVLTSFYLYVLPCLEQLIGRKESFLTKIHVGLLDEYTKTNDMTHLLKGRIYLDKVEILSAQSSAMLNSFVQANCIVYLPEGKSNWDKGEMVEVFSI